MMGSKKIVISGYYGFDNSGDDAILKAIVNDLRENNNNLDICALSKKPNSTESNYDIKSIDRFSYIKVLKGIMNSDMLISGGGSLLQDVTSTRSILYYLTLIYITKLLKKPVMIYANGIGPINKKINRFLTKRILNKVDLISLRDYNSKKTIEELGVINENIFVTADPVFTLKASDEDVVNDILTKEGIPLDKPLVGISVRAWGKNKSIVEVLSNCIDYIKNTYDVNVVLIPMHYPEDLKISNEICNLSKSKCYCLTNQYSVENIMGIINQLEIIIAMRLHSLIYAATQAVPMIGLVYDPKVDGFMDSIDLDSKINVDKLEIIELCNIFDKVWNERRKIKVQLEEKRKEFIQKSKENIDMVISLLKEW